MIYAEFCGIQLTPSNGVQPRTGRPGRPRNGFDKAAYNRQFMRERRARLPAEDEPVAWRRELSETQPSHVTQFKETADAWEEDGFTVTPLFTRLASLEITDEMVERAAKAMWSELQGYGQFPWDHPAEPGSILEADFQRARQKARAALTAALGGKE